MDPESNQSTQPNQQTQPTQPVQPVQPAQPIQTSQPPQQEQPEKKGMSDDTKTIITVVVLLLAFPIGLILMWFWVKWPVWIKILLTIPIIFAILGIIGAIVIVGINPSEQIERANEAQMRFDQQQQGKLEELQRIEEFKTPTPLPLQ